MMRMAEGTLEFFDHNSILSKKVKDTLESTKGYLDLWNQYAEQEGNLLLEEVRKIGLITVNRDAATFDSEGIHLPYLPPSYQQLFLLRLHRHALQ